MTLTASPLACAQRLDLGARRHRKHAVGTELDGVVAGRPQARAGGGRIADHGAGAQEDGGVVAQADGAGIAHRELGVGLQGDGRAGRGGRPWPIGVVAGFGALVLQVVLVPEVTQAA